MDEYPQHEKLKKIADTSQVCGNFLDWLFDEKNLTLALYHGDDLRVYFPNKPELLAEFFGIDAVA